MAQTLEDWLIDEQGDGKLLANDLWGVQVDAANFLSYIGDDDGHPDPRVPAGLRDALRLVADWEVNADAFK